MKFPSDDELTAGPNALEGLIPAGGWPEDFRAGFASWLEPPRTQLTLMIDLDGAITADGERLPDAWIGGLEESYTVVVG